MVICMWCKALRANGVHTGVQCKLLWLARFRDQICQDVDFQWIVSRFLFSSRCVCSRSFPPYPPPPKCSLCLRPCFKEFVSRSLFGPRCFRDRDTSLPPPPQCFSCIRPAGEQTYMHFCPGLQTLNFTLRCKHHAANPPPPQVDTDTLTWPRDHADATCYPPPHLRIMLDVLRPICDLLP